jgi:hypothetical protein
MSLSAFPMPFRRILIVAISLLLLLGGPRRLYSQYKTKKQHISPTLIIDQSDLIYDLLESFDLVRKANDGDPRAQHERGSAILSDEFRQIPPGLCGFRAASRAT